MFLPAPILSCHCSRASATCCLCRPPSPQLHVSILVPFQPSSLPGVYTVWLGAHLLAVSCPAVQLELGLSRTQSPCSKGHGENKERNEGFGFTATEMFMILLHSSVLASPCIRRRIQGETKKTSYSLCSLWAGTRRRWMLGDGCEISALGC